MSSRIINRKRTPKPMKPMAAREDRERIRSLVRQYDGRVYQQTIIEETGWSPTKVSLLLTELEKEGLVTRIAVGWENVVALPEQLSRERKPA